MRTQTLPQRRAALPPASARPPPMGPLPQEKGMRVCDLVFGHKAQPSGIRAWAVSPGCRQAPKGASFRKRKRYGLIFLNTP